MKLLRYIIILLTLAWATEDVARFVYTDFDQTHVAVEMGGGEEVEKKSEYEIKEYTTDQDVTLLLIAMDTQTGVGAMIYKAPVISIPDVPPEESC